MGVGTSRQPLELLEEPKPLTDPAFSTLASESLVPFPGGEFPFLPAVQAVLRCEGVPLGDLHRFRLTEEFGQVEGSAGPPFNLYNKRWQTAKHTHEASGYDRFNMVYHDFLRDVVRTDLGEDMILYQRIPTLRVHLAGAQPIGRPHRDSDYLHTAFELNYWLPLTDVGGTNSLLAESVRDRGDFHPFVASYGQAVRFYGNQVWHYTVRNDSERTRVSFDFRVVRFSDLHRAGVPVDYSREKHSRLEHRLRGKGGQFCLGSFYGLMGPGGEVPRERAEALCALEEESRLRSWWGRR